MKKILYWFFGETAARAITAGWKWLWGRTISTGNTLTLEAAKESLSAMQESVDQLTESVAQVASVYTQAQQKLDAHQLDFNKANQQAELALKDGNEAAARLAIARALTLEKALPNLTQMVEKSRHLLDCAKQDLQEEREKLEACRFEMGNLKAIAEMNEALTQVMKQTGDYSVNSARDQFESAETAIKNKNYQVVAQRELSQNPARALEKELDNLSQTEAIEKRLNTLRNKQKNNLTVIVDIADPHRQNA